MRLGEMKSGQRGRILKVHFVQTAYRKRLLDLGLLPGTEFEIARIAPLGDPIQIKIRGFALILRKKEAAILEVERVNA